MACNFYPEAYSLQRAEVVSSAIGHIYSYDAVWRQPIGHRPSSFVPQWPAQPPPDMNHRDEAFSGDVECSPIQDQPWQNYALMSQWDGDQPPSAVEASADPLQQIAYDTHDSAEHCSSFSHLPFHSAYRLTPGITHCNPIYPPDSYASIPYTLPYAQPAPLNWPEWTNTYPDHVDPPYYRICTRMPRLCNGSISSSFRESSFTSPEAEHLLSYSEDEQLLSYPEDKQPLSHPRDNKKPISSPISYCRDSVHVIRLKAKENVQVDSPSLGNVPGDVSANLTLDVKNEGHVDDHSPSLSTSSPVPSSSSSPPSAYIETEEAVIETPRRLKPFNPYICDICSVFFIRRHDGLRHRRTHTGETPYVCKGCFEGFKRTDARDRHWGHKPSCEVAHVLQIAGTPEGEARERRQMRKQMKAAGTV